MKFKYRIMWFDFPEYSEGNCDTVETFDDPEKAYLEINKLEASNSNESIFYQVCLSEDA